MADSSIKSGSLSTAMAVIPYGQMEKARNVAKHRKLIKKGLAVNAQGSARGPIQPAKPSAVAGAVLRVPEIALNVASHLEGPHLFTAFRLTAPMQSIFHDKVFWQEKLGQHGLANIKGAEIGASNLRHRYQHRLRTLEAIRKNQAPLCNSVDLRENTADHLRRGPGNMTLIFRRNQDTGLSDIYSLGEIAHEGQPAFRPESIFAGGQLCMGWENDRKVVRKVDDWSLAVDRLDTAPDDGPVSFDVAKRWGVSGTSTSSQ